MTAAKLALELLAMIAIGYYAEKRRIVGEQFNADLAAFITNISLPCLIVQSMQVPFSMDELKNCGYLVLLALGYLAVCFAMAQIGWYFSPRDYRGRIMRFGMIFTNFTFMGIPVVQTLYGDQGVFYFVVFLVPIRIVFYSSAKPMLSPPDLKLETQSLSQKLKGWLSPPVAGVLIGLALYISGIRLSGVIGDIVSNVACICSPMGMILCGITLGKYPIRSLLRKRCFLLAGIRCLLIPGVIFCLCHAIGLAQQLMEPVVICAALPIASLSAAFTVRYDPNPEAHYESAGCVLLSTLLSAATIPLWAWLLAL
ncbi:MAG: AEC family transporter [Clostridiales bacterium]|nr:AEC family transporter [Candidatus Cacconaster stercorequi]